MISIRLIRMLLFQYTVLSFKCFVKKSGRSSPLYDLHHVTSSLPAIIDHMSLTTSVVPIKVLLSSNIPIELNAWDEARDVLSMDSVKSFTSSKQQIPIMLPNTEIGQLYGGYNLGTLLWTVVVYYGGPVPSKMSLADMTIPFVCKILGISTSINSTSTDNQWYLDFNDGYSFQSPPYIDFIRLVIFGTLGYCVNTYLIESLGEGDIFWGWSTALSTCFPTFLVAVSRDKRVTREFGMLEREIKENFRIFRETRLKKGAKGGKCAEDAVLTAYQRVYGKSDIAFSRNKRDVSFAASDLKLEELREKTLIRIIRQWYGRRPDRDGNYPELELLPPPPIVVDATLVQSVLPVKEVSASLNVEAEEMVNATPGNPFV